MSSRTPISRLELIRKSRSLPPGATPIAPAVQAAAAEIRAAAKQAERAESAWSRVAPPALAGLVSRVESGGGVLKLKPRSAAARFALDRWLRSGGEALLRGADARISSVRLVR